MDGQWKNNFETEGSSERCPGQQLPPYYLPTYNVKAFDRNYGREIIPTPREEWSASRLTKELQELIPRVKRSIACRRGNREELSKKVDKLVNGLDKLQEGIWYGATFMDPEILGNGWGFQECDLYN